MESPFAWVLLGVLVLVGAKKFLSEKNLRGGLARLMQPGRHREEPKQSPLPTSKDFEYSWRLAEKPPQWRLAEGEHEALIQAWQVASAIAPLIGESRDIAFARLESMRGTVVTRASVGFRDLLADIVDLEGAFETLLLAPGQALPEAL